MNNDLKNRIRQGRIWILKNDNDPNISKAMELYAELVDEANKLGISEEECWNYEPRAAYEFTEDEIINLFTGGSNGKV